MPLININEVAGMVGFHPRTIMRQADAGNFPGPIRMGKTGHTRWHVDDVKAWIAEQRKAGQVKVAS